MIVIEHVTINNTDFTRTYSDANRFIVCGDEQYTEAYDLASLPREYVEGDVIPPEDLPEVDQFQDKAEGYEILVGERE